MDDKAMDSYDATLALLTGIKIALSMRKNITSNDLRQALTKIVGPNAIQGVTGAISFGPDGDATNKAVAVIKIDSNGNFVLDQMNGTLLLGS
jgi:ABC-type branched-subunit amino acid transport system substrate-binding protein